MPAVYFYAESEVQYPEKLHVLKLHEKKLYLRSLENGDSLVAEATLGAEWSFVYNSTPYLITQRNSYLKQVFCAWDYVNTHQREENGVLEIKQATNLSPKNELYSNVFSHHVHITTQRLRLHTGLQPKIQNTDVFSDCILPCFSSNIHVDHGCNNIDLFNTSDIVLSHGCKTVSIYNAQHIRIEHNCSNIKVNGFYGGKLTIENNCENIEIQNASGQKINIKLTNGLKIQDPQTDVRTWLYEKGKCVVCV